VGGLIAEDSSFERLRTSRGKKGRSSSSLEGDVPGIDQEGGVGNTAISSREGKRERKKY